MTDWDTAVDELGWARRQGHTSRLVKSPDGTEWIVETVRVGVPQMGYSLAGLVGLLGGRIYHRLRHRGEWRLEVSELGVSTIWEIGVYSREEAEAEAALHIAELEAGRWRPHPPDERLRQGGAVATDSPAKSVGSATRRATVVTVLLLLVALGLLVLVLTADDLGASETVGLIAGCAVALVAMLRWGPWRAER